MDVSPSTLFHILNPNAARRADVQSFFAGSPWDHIWVERTSHPTHLETVVNWAVNESRPGIAIWGGDGTFSRAVNALNDLGALETMAVALIPVGTCNDFARHLPLPAWRKMFLTGDQWTERRVDIGVLAHAEGDRLFVNNAGFGRRPNARRDRRPNPVSDIFRMRPEPVEIVTRDTVERRERINALMGIVFNAPYFGGGMHFNADTRSDDGLLDGYFVRDQGRIRLLWSFLMGRSGKPFENPGTTATRGRAISVTTSGDMFPQADGESASQGAVKSIDFSVRPGALRLLVPRIDVFRKEPMNHG